MIIRQRVPSRVIVSFLLAFLAVPGVLSQNLADLEDPIYEALEAWEALDYIAPLPYLQPYTPQRVIVALEEAAGVRAFSGGVAAPRAVKRRAEEWLIRIRDGEKPVTGRLYSRSRIARYKDDDNQYHGLYIPAIEAVWPISEMVQFHGRFGEVFVDYPDGPALPYRRREMQEWITDTSGKVEPFGRDMYQQHQLVTNMTVGSREVSFLTGMSRSSFGPIHEDGIYLSSEAPGSAQFILTWDAGVFVGQLLYRPISAGTFGGTGRKPDKHLMFHSLQYRPLSWLTLNFNEAVVWGGYFNPAYFVPANSFFLTQGLTGFDGNSFLGLSALFEPIPGLRIPLAVNMDDMHWSDMVRGDWDTKYKLALQGAVDWYPAAQDIPVITRAILDYTAVTPYTYTHWDTNPTPTAGEFNFSNYTHLGTNMATGLHPNSDRVRLQLAARPIAGLALDFSALSIRHGNASEGILPENPATGTGTGTIFDPGYDGSKPTFQRPYEDPTGQPYTRFLTQDVIEKARQIGASLTFRVPLAKLFESGTRTPSLRIGAGYTFEYIKNADLVEGAESVGHYFDINLTAEY